jgi:hypothetical protein
MRPRTDAGKSLRALSLALTRITDLDQAADWTGRLHSWHQVYAELINAKTYLKDTGIRPASAKPNATWWWTHERLRKAYKLLERLTRRGILFTYLDPKFKGLNISSTTNRIEGGANHPIKNLLRLHTGMTSDHQRRAAQWWCYLHSPDPRPAHELIAPAHYAPPPPPRPEPDKPIGPALYDTALTDKEGLWTRKTRKGWAGRTS